MFAAFIIACAAATGQCKAYVPTPRFDDLAKCEASIKGVAAEVDGKFQADPNTLALGVSVRKYGCVKVR